MEVSYKFGGEICFNETDCSSRPLLLLAGGIGINPLFSIMQRAVELNKQPVTLLYSSKTSEELIFKVGRFAFSSSFTHSLVGVVTVCTIILNGFLKLIGELFYLKARVS